MSNKNFSADGDEDDDEDHTFTFYFVLRSSDCNAKFQRTEGLVII